MLPTIRIALLITVLGRIPTHTVRSIDRQKFLHLFSKGISGKLRKLIMDFRIQPRHLKKNKYNSMLKVEKSNVITNFYHFSKTNFNDCGFLSLSSKAFLRLSVIGLPDKLRRVRLGNVEYNLSTSTSEHDKSETKKDEELS